jgi:hypothetical protein
VGYARRAGRQRLLYRLARIAGVRKRRRLHGRGRRPPPCFRRSDRREPSQRVRGFRARRLSRHLARSCVRELGGRLRRVRTSLAAPDPAADANRRGGSTPSRMLAPRGLSERHGLDAPPAHGRNLEGHLETTESRVAREKAFGRATQAPEPLWADRLPGVPERGPAPHLHLGGGRNVGRADPLRGRGAYGGRSFIVGPISPRLLPAERGSTRDRSASPVRQRSAQRRGYDCTMNSSQRFTVKFASVCARSSLVSCRWRTAANWELMPWRTTRMLFSRSSWRSISAPRVSTR